MLKIMIPGIMLCTFILEAFRTCFYMRYFYTCIGEYRSPKSKRIILAACLVWWTFESFVACLFPESRQFSAMLYDFFWFLYELPFLLIISLFYRGGVLQHLLTVLLVPFTYWAGKWVIAYTLFSTIYAIDNRQYLIATAVAVLLFCTLELILEKIGKSRRELERERLEQEIHIYENQFDVIRQSQSNIRSLKHDMKHHIKMLADMITADEKEGALNYLASMGEFMENSEEYVVSGNAKIDSILNYMISRAKKSGIGIDWKIQIPEHLDISTFDINVILSNLFDNALNALSYVSDPALYFAIKYDRGILLIDMQNNYSINDSALKSSDGHGFGLKNIRRIAEKYHGNLTTICSNGNFHANVLLFLE